MADKKFNALEALKEKFTKKTETAATTAAEAVKPVQAAAAQATAKTDNAKLAQEAAAKAAAAKEAVAAKEKVTSGRPIATARPMATTTPKKSVDELAKEVIRGDWGNGQERKDKLAAAGYNYDEVQDRVNAILYGNTATTATPLSATKKSVEEIAKEVIRGNWGNGQERKDKLAAAGYNYDEVQAKVNELLK